MKGSATRAGQCALGVVLAWTLWMPGPLSAHHSFAVWDFETEILFEGVVETLNFRNPHIAMTLTLEREDGTTETVVFEEGAPANMLVRRGLTEAMVSPGTRLAAVGSPRRDGRGVFFLRTLILDDGREF